MMTLTSDSGLWALGEPVLFGAFLVLLRLLGVIIVLPGMAQGGFPSPTRILLAVFMTIIIYSGLGMPLVPVPAEVGVAITHLLREFLLGFSMGFVIRVMFAVADSAGAIIGMSISLSMAGMVDPTSGEQTTAVSNLLAMGGMLLFVALDGHQVVVEGLMLNFDEFPVGGLGFVTLDQDALVGIIRGLFAAALQIAAPIIIVSTLVNVALGLMARAAPQMNIFAVGFSVLLCVGLFVLDRSVINLHHYYQDRLSTLEDDMNTPLVPVAPIHAPTSPLFGGPAQPMPSPTGAAR